MSRKGGSSGAWDCVKHRSAEIQPVQLQHGAGGVCEPHHRLQSDWEVMLTGEGGPVFFGAVESPEHSEFCLTVFLSLSLSRVSLPPLSSAILGYRLGPLNVAVTKHLRFKRAEIYF